MSENDIVFGAKDEQQVYQPRFGAYVVIPNKEGKIILVQAPNGAYFLPGGEIEAGETKETAIARELIEELGFKGEIETYFGEAVEYFYSRHRDTYYYHPGYFFLMTIWQKVCAPTEDNNQLSWQTPEKAIQLLKRGSHQWAVKQWLQQKSKQE